MNDAFHQLWTHCQLDGNSDAVFDQLYRAYSETHRHYHNLQHLSECLSELEAVRPALPQHEIHAVEMALWFHDAVYDTHAADNEARSAEFAVQTLSAANASRSFIDQVSALILATKTHPSSNNPAIAIMLDIDLSILGKPSERYWQYEAQIRAEYHWVPPALFSAKRIEVLDQFLARDFVYLTPIFRERCETQARRNLSAAIQNLRKELSTPD
ncbi:N-methyl-D-aspartate receptor NMDAR2C subunit [Phragmitibacter flavus]|uniref:N-methyl-D-aspartate receptor NMDAR2C subunit n=1 Tax=Phragmitibacter flavus TaxID=2576071 RepID=A0A5R8KK44_9BACT|nr:N-methyl-D-aspartate receptor NMDAR2C subunit [Phragmitibacter flavus]TLD72620.1 N-methyl-D-aspartate receptor NMDAR2C subunit [Phragmitibacter flavus]